MYFWAWGHCYYVENVIRYLKLSWTCIGPFYDIIFFYLKKVHKFLIKNKFTCKILTIFRSWKKKGHEDGRDLKDITYEYSFFIEMLSFKCVFQVWKYKLSSCKIYISCMNPILTVKLLHFPHNF